ncbi:YciI family protein [Pseudarthrobacter sp. NPDC058119]|uniref:YciI family protein n=1 Tax=Pseudarthrobacter sp. NPDC058119 TaxID=3346348 RepID=UPI0036DF8FCF
MIYSLREGVDRSTVMAVYPRHKAYYEAFTAAGGGLTALGPFQSPEPGLSSMGIFTSRSEAERFIAGDPFVTEGLADPRLLEWNVVHLA